MAWVCTKRQLRDTRCHPDPTYIILKYGRIIDRVPIELRSDDLLPVRPTKKVRRDAVHCGSGQPTSELVPQGSHPAHATIVRDTVLGLMHDYWRQDSDALSSDLDSAENTIADQAAQVSALQYRIQMLEARNITLAHQLTDMHRFTRMIHDWVPVVREMFDQDYEATLAMHAHQWAAVAAIDEVDLTTEEDTDEE